jgi:hypothetical protein
VAERLGEADLGPGHAQPSARDVEIGSVGQRAGHQRVLVEGRGRQRRQLAHRLEALVGGGADHPRQLGERGVVGVLGVEAIVARSSAFQRRQVDLQLGAGAERLAIARGRHQLGRQRLGLAGGVDPCAREQRQLERAPHLELGVELCLHQIGARRGDACVCHCAAGIALAPQLDRLRQRYLGVEQCLTAAEPRADRHAQLGVVDRSSRAGGFGAHRVDLGAGDRDRRAARRAAYGFLERDGICMRGSESGHQDGADHRSRQCERRHR